MDPQNQDGVVQKIPCECGKVYIGETGRCMHERIKEHDKDIRLSRTQTSAVSEHANKTGHNLTNYVGYLSQLKKKLCALTALIQFVFRLP